MDRIQKAKTPHTLVVIGITSLLPIVLSCEQKRESDFVQGDGKHLYSIEDLSSRSAILKTGQRINDGIASVTTSSKLVINSSNTGLMVNKDIVSFDLSDDPLNINSSSYQYDFFGEENSTYQVKYTFTEKHLIVNKITKIEDLPSNERTYATKLGKGLYQVPMFGFPISKYVIEHVKDQRGKRTDKLKSIKVQYLSEATHVSFNQGDIKFFEPASKLDTIPSNIFNGSDEWFFSKTLVDRPAIPSGPICPGGGICNEIGMQESKGKISFQKTQSSIGAYDVNIPDATPEDRTRQLLLEIPISWLDFRIDQEGLSEEKIDDEFPGARPWNERQYAQVDFKRVSNISDASSNAYKIEHMEISENYIGFKVFESESQRSYFYSFAKASSKTKKPRVYPISDHKKFGYFRTVKSTIEGDINVNRTEEIDSLVYLNRIYPRDGEKDVTIYLTKDSARHPNGDYAKAVSDAIKSWNEAFKAAGAGFGLKFGGAEDSDRVENGDVRYHKVAIYDDDRRSRLLGYGPSVPDSRTGETFSSSNHIYLRNYKQGLKSSIQKFIYWQLGAYDSIALGPIEDFISSDSNPSSTESTLAEVFNSNSDHGNVQLAFDGRLNDFSLMAENHIIPSSEALPTRDAHFEKYSCNYLENSMPVTVKKIQQKCLSNAAEDSKFARYLDAMKSMRDAGDASYAMSFDDRDGLLDEAAALEDCASRLIGDKLRATLVHEFGHNFGLRHNFAASSDKENLRVDPENQSIQTSASVMDYAHNDADRNINLGAYDFAAVRFAYANEIEIISIDNPDDRKFIKIPDGKSIDATVAQHPGYILKQYKFCTDEDVSNGSVQIPKFDPQCKRWDNGSTVVENARDIIQQMSAYILTNTKRLDREYGFPKTTQFNSAIEAKYLFSLKQIYDYYRWILAGKNPESSDQSLYLKGLDSDGVERLKAEAEAKFGDEFVEYEKAATLIKKFLQDIVFNLDNSYCVISDRNDPASIPYALVFGMARTQILREQNHSLTDCQDPVLRSELITGFQKHQNILRSNYTAISQEDYEITSFGVPVEPLVARNQNNPLELKLIEHGLLGLRQAAANMLFNAGTSATSELDNVSYLPSMANEPEIRESARERLMQRLLNGKLLDKSYSRAGDDQDEIGFIQGPFFPDFQSEKEIYDNIIEGTRDSLSFSEKRSLSFSFITTSTIEAEEFKERNNINEFVLFKAGKDFFNNNPNIPNNENQTRSQNASTSYLFANANNNPRSYLILKKLNLLQAGEDAFGLGLHKMNVNALTDSQLNDLKAILSDRLMANQRAEDVSAILQDTERLKEAALLIKQLAMYSQQYSKDLSVQIKQLSRLLFKEVI